MEEWEDWKRYSSKEKITFSRKKRHTNKLKRTAEQSFEKRVTKGCKLLVWRPKANNCVTCIVTSPSGKKIFMLALGSLWSQFSYVFFFIIYLIFYEIKTKHLLTCLLHEYVGDTQGKWVTQRSILELQLI